MRTLNRRYKELRTGKTVTVTGWDGKRVFFVSEDYEFDHMLPLHLFKQRYVRAENDKAEDEIKQGGY